MTKHTLKVITRSAEQWIKGIELCRKKCKEDHISVLVIDFSETYFLEPYHIVSLACLIEENYKNNVSIEFVASTNYHINHYLTNIRLLEYWSSRFNRNAFTKLKIETALCLWQVRNDMIDSYATEAQKYFQNAYLKGKSLDSLHISLTEVFNNIFDHSGSLVDGYVLTQYYPKIGKIVTSICDFGIGIPKKINQYWIDHKKEMLPDDLALKAALKRKVSSQSTPHNRGFGLANILDSVSKLGGEVEIRSNYAVFSMSEGMRRSYLSNKYFSGTLIIITFNERYLPDIEAEVANEDFNF